MKFLLSTFLLFGLTFSSYAKDGCMKAYKEQRRSALLNGIGASIFIITIPAAVPNLKLAVGAKKMIKLLKEVKKGNLNGKWTKKLVQKLDGKMDATLVHQMVRELNFKGEGGLCTVRYNEWEGYNTWHVKTFDQFAKDLLD